MDRKERLALVYILINFDGDEILLRLNETMSIKRIDETWLEDLLSQLADKFSITYPAFHQVHDAKFALEIRGGFENEKMKHDVVLALELLKCEDLDVSGAILLENGKPRAVDLTPIKLTRSKGKSYYLKKEETTLFMRLWRKIQLLDNGKPNLRFPLSQFSKALDQEHSEDRIVDCMTAFESIVFHNEPKSIEPAGKVIGTAIGMLLGNNQKDRDKIKEMFVKSYSVRNAKVHGNVKALKTLQRKHDIDEVSDFIEDYLRRVLTKFIEE